MPRSKKVRSARAKTKTVAKPHLLKTPVKPIISFIVIALAAAGLLLAVQASQHTQNLASDAAGKCVDGAQKCASSSHYQKCVNGTWHWQTYRCSSSTPYCVDGQCTSKKPYYAPCDGWFKGVTKDKPLTVKVGEAKFVGINPGSGNTIRVVCDQTKKDPKIYTLTVNEDKSSPFQCKIKGESPGTHNLRVRLWKDPGTEKTCYINTKVIVTE